MGIEVIEAVSLWNNSGTSDKVYNVQLIKIGEEYEVNAQWGKRVNVIQERFQDRARKYFGNDKWVAKETYATLLRSKVKKGYDKTIDPIIPIEYRGGTFGATVSKEELATMAKNVMDFKDFLTSVPEDEKETKSGWELLIESLR